MDINSYFQLRATLYHREENQKVNFKLQELEKLWFCTAKNCKRKLKKFEQEDFFIYQPGIGRGNASQLKFRHPFHVEVQNIVQHYKEKEQLEEVLQLMHLPIPN